MMKVILQLRFLLLFVFIFTEEILAKEVETWTPLDTLLTKQIIDIVVSPNGEQSFVVVVEPSAQDQNPQKIKRSVSCYRVDNNSGKVASFLKNQESVSIDWSYDGNWIVYNTIDGDKAKLWVKPVKGGKSQLLLESKKVGGNLSVSPDGKKVATTFSTHQDTNYNPKISEENGRIAIVHFEDENYQKPKLEELTPSTNDINNPFYSWSPDSRYIAFAKRSPNWKRGIVSSLAIVDVDTKKITELVKEQPFLSDPIFSPDQKYIAYIQGSERASPLHGGGITSQSTRICIYNLKDKRRHCIAEKLSGLTSLIGWTADSQHLLYNKWDKTKLNIHQINVEGAQDHVLNKDMQGVVVGFHVSHNNHFLSFSYSQMTTLDKGYVTNLSKVNPKNIYSLESKPSLKWLNAEVIEWPSFDRRKIEGILTYPKGYKEGNKIPLVLWIHGGPAGISNEDFQGRTAFGPFSPAVLASQGYAILQPNYRGSKGYDFEFSTLSYKDFGGGDFQDVLTGVNFLVNQGIVDPERIIIAGWSYGGFLSAWGITHDHRFKAAIVGAGPVNWYASIAGSDNNLMAVSYLGSNIKDLYRMSPLSYIKNAKTPVLIQQGSYDQRVPFVNSLEFAYVLKKLHIPYKGIAYTGQRHEFTSDFAKYQAMEDQQDWVKKYIKPYEKTQ